MITDIKIQAQGRWSSILQNLGIPAQAFNGKHQPCPVCEGTDRFRWNRAKEAPYCSGCGVVTPMQLAIEWLGLDFKSSASEIRKILGNTVETKANYTTDDVVKNQARIDKIKAGLKRINGECAVSKYLAKRGINVLPEQDCYSHQGINYYDSDGQKVGTFPAMVSIFRNNENKGATFHITYLTAEGEKAPVEKVKKVLPVVLPLAGCAIKLFKPIDGQIAIAEGIETALAVHKSEGYPVWAAGNWANFAALELPPEITTLYLFPDPDIDGMAAAFKLASRYKKLEIFFRFSDHQGNLIDWRSHKDDFLDWMLVEENEKQKYGI